MPPKKTVSKAAPKKAVPKKAAPKKATSKKAAPKKAAPKKATSKKAAPKKAASVTPKAAAAKSTTAARKRTTSAPRISTAPSTAASTNYIQWYFMGDGGSWVKFNDSQNQIMEDAYSRAGGTGAAKMSYNNWDYTVDFTNLIQENLSTHRTRQLKRDSTKASSASLQKVKESASGKRQRTVQKGRGVVDPLSGKVDTCHVYEGNNEVFQCTLNQTNISTNNNKFYILQLLEEDDKSEYYLFTRWGRVGVDGQMLTERYANVSAAVAAYKKKFNDKTQNNWDNRENFVKVQGKYFLMKIDYTAGDDDDEEKVNAALSVKKKARGEAPKPMDSQLPKSVQNLMKLIGSREAMTTTLKELNIDTQRMPLGKISKAQITQAYGYLQDIEAELKKAAPKVEEATALFYTLIPHDFGFRRPPLINSEEMLKEKLELLEVLGQLEIASTLLDSGASATTAVQVTKHPFDKTYDSLRCSIEPLDKSSAEFKRIVDYTSNTHGKTHTTYTLVVEEVFAVRREGEDTRYKSLSNRQMLWHGSRTTNYMGILSQGLRIAPPEAPVTGYMFGKGIYLANASSKSANYCNTTRSNNTGLMLLCETSLGKHKDFSNACYMEKPHAGFDSSKGVGRMCPNEAGYETVNGVVWPMGKMVDNKKNSSLLYDEFIVYDVKQCKIQYLVQMRFKYK